MSAKWAERLVSWGVFGILLATYWLTAAPTVSYWDCPEYVAAAWKLEIGHPPGNPTWMLAERVITMLAPSGREAALLVNLSSGLFTAFAAFFLARIIFAATGWIADSLSHKPWKVLTQSVAAATGALSFGWCDSAWYSAVEAEVYAMSIFMTALCVWLMVKWAFCHSHAQSCRYLILIAYLFGLSLGIHQLNLLCIPALAIIWCIKRKIRKWWAVTGIFLLSLVIVGAILMVMMPGTISLAAAIELFTVNRLGLPYLSGIVIFLLLIGALLLAGIIFTKGRANTCVWMLAMLLTGYSSYALIPIRGSIPSPANSSLPGDPFSFASYLAREQYGGAPLLYGHTPYSKEMLKEEFSAADNIPIYRRAALERKHRIIVRKEANARIADPYRMLTPKDSIFNEKALSRKGDAYVVRSYAVKPVLTPELNMWFPRITSRDKTDIQCFADWAGMTKENMTKVNITEVIDTAGNFNGRLLADGTRSTAISYRPTYPQSLKMFLTYQCGYMYFRYLLWNFLGRQNDEHSTGEVEHGNFITGINALDNLMLGAEDALPSRLGRNNKGRNSYLLLPFLLGIVGIITLCKCRKRGQKVCIATAILFVMTGLAIVVYLNQSPGEPRERDYSFLGSYMAFAAWIGFGAFGLMRTAGKYAPAAAVLPLFSAVWMCLENYDDHNRTGRYAASHIAANILNSLPEDAIIFVDGDNSTFPLWYAQEVEGIRKDVRVVNLAYLSMPQYTAALMQDWDGAKGINTVLKREDIIYGGLQFPKISEVTTDTAIPASVMLQGLADSQEEMTGYLYVKIPLPKYSSDNGADCSRDSITIPIRNLTKVKGGRGLDFRKLMILDIISSNSGAEEYRPIYWLRELPARHFSAFDNSTSEGMFAVKYGLATADTREQEYLKSLDKLIAPNEGADVYLDGTPAGRVSSHRASLLMAARDMLRTGHLPTALRLATAADSLMGYDLRTYSSVRNHDSIFPTRQEMVSIFRELADSVENSNRIEDKTVVGKLRKRAEVLQHQDSINKMEWQRYYRTLPTDLRLKISR